jgi:putative transcriptional regulator
MTQFEENLIKGLEEALAIMEGRAKPAREDWIEVPDIDVAGLRRELNLSQAEFADRFGFKITAVRNWEQRRRTPHGSARLLLHIIRKRPDAVEDVLRDIQPSRSAALPRPAPD